MALLENMLPRQAPVVGAVAHREIDFSRQKVRFARVRRQCPTHDFLRLTPCIAIGRVEEIDAQVIGFLDTARCRLIFGRPAVSQPGAERDFADAHSIFAQMSIMHNKPFRVK